MTRGFRSGESGGLGSKVVHGGGGDQRVTSFMVQGWGGGQVLLGPRGEVQSVTQLGI